MLLLHHQTNLQPVQYYHVHTAKIPEATKAKLRQAMNVGEKMELNIFEPRYRLLVRRCMEGNRRFGMATVNQRSQLSAVACQCEILECLPLPDGLANPDS